MWTTIFLRSSEAFHSSRDTKRSYWNSLEREYFPTVKMYFSSREDFHDSACVLNPSPAPSSPHSVRMDLSAANDFSTQFSIDGEAKGEMTPSRSYNRPDHHYHSEATSLHSDTSNSSWRSANSDYSDAPLNSQNNQLDTHKLPEFGILNMDNYSATSSPSAIAVLHNERRASCPLFGLETRDQYPILSVHESPFDSVISTPGCSLSSSSSSIDPLSEDRLIDKNESMYHQVIHDPRANIYQSAPASPRYFVPVVFGQNDCHGNELRQSAPTRPYRSLFPCQIGAKETECTNGIYSDIETSTPNIPNTPFSDVNPYLNYNNYANPLPSPRSYHQQRYSDERLCNMLADPPRGSLGYLSEPRRERSHSLASQSAYDINSYSAAQPFYAPYQADHKIPIESKSQAFSQAVAEAQHHVHAKIMFTQQRIQDQHLQQQQFQQLHRLHTQQLKQAKQKNFDSRLQHSDMPKYQQQATRSSLEGSVYQVQFKRNHRYMILDDSIPTGVELGSFVIVEADRGEDLGVVVFIAARDSSLATTLHAANNAMRAGSENTLKKILRLASLHERADLPRKAKDEMDILSICREMAPQKYQLSISLEDAEYQFDRHKLILYYSAARRIDFREFVRDLYAVYKIRIWMQPVDVTNGFRPSDTASRALATGFLNDPSLPLREWTPIAFAPENTTSLSHTSNCANPSGLLGVNQPPKVGGSHIENSLRSCPPSASGTYSNLNTGYYGGRIQQPTPFLPMGR